MAMGGLTGTGRPTLPVRSKTSMSREFEQAVWPASSLASAGEVFHLAEPPEGDLAGFRDFIGHAKAVLQVVDTDFKTGRMTRAQREKVPEIPKGHHAYNKRFRILRRLEAKYADYARVARQRQLAQTAKSGLASEISYEEFSRDENTARFVAYYTATLNRRSIFTWGKQERAFDSNADALYRRLNGSANWLAVAYVYPREEVLARLTDGERGRLLGAWFGVMKECASILGGLASTQSLDLKNMVVHRGNDSSTWNESAGAYNKARDGWIACLHAIGCEAMLDGFCPGKALRLMAGDVAFLHRAFGDGLEPDTAVWHELPKPWDVISGAAALTRGTVEAECFRRGIEGGKGWYAPRAKGAVAAFRPTPELVHGVAVSSPELAALLRKLGAFAGPSKAA